MSFSNWAMMMTYVAFALALVMVPSTRAQLDCSQSSGFQPDASQFAEVRYREQTRRGITKRLVTQAEVLWQPLQMLDNPACYDIPSAELLMRPGNTDEWIPLPDIVQRSAGQSTKWTVDVKPCLAYQFKIRVGNGGVELELPNELGPSQEAEILESGYQPETPDKFAASTGANSAAISWHPVDCADAYEVSYVEVGKEASSAVSPDMPDKGSSSVQLSGLQPCQRYEVTVSAMTGETYSDDLIRTVVTKPRLDAAANLEPEINPGLDSVTVTWETWVSASCIERYQIEITCRGCPPGSPSHLKIVEKPTGLPYLTFSLPSGSLQPCTDYVLSILPLYEGVEIEPKEVSFRTLSPGADTLSVERVSTRAASTASMVVEWTPVNCASGYRVYQKEPQASDWSHVADTPADGDSTEITVGNITPCTKYHFAISAILADGSETPRAIGPELMSDLDESQPFEVPNLHINNADNQADISWGHADCIASYDVKVCESAYTDNCQKHQVEPQAAAASAAGKEDKSVHFRAADLQPCTLYTLEIIPHIIEAASEGGHSNKKFTAKPADFTTTNGMPQTPASLKVELKSGDSSAVELSWDAAQCATNYRVYQKVGEEISSEVTEGVRLVYSHPVACETYFYALATMVDELESPLSEWFSVSIPPRPGQQPKLKILSREGSNATIRLGMPETNNRCTAQEYEIAYSSDGGATFGKKRMTAQEVKEAKGDLMVMFKGASDPQSIISGRIKYSGAEDMWSEAATVGGNGAHLGKATSASMGGAAGGQESQDSSGTIIPVVVGVILVAVIVVVLVALLLRRKKRSAEAAAAAGGSRTDPEKADNKKKGHKHLVDSNDDDETRKLNENA